MPSTILSALICLLTIAASVISLTQGLPALPIRAGFLCTKGVTPCEPNTQCISVSGKYTCVPLPDYTYDGRSGILGTCKNDSNCVTSLKCRQGRCHDRSLGDTCKITKSLWGFLCQSFQSCVDGICQYGYAGSQCTTTWRYTRCLPGLRCVGDAGPNAPPQAPGTCQAIKEGDKCLFGSECPTGMICGTRGTCAKDATGQPCRSDFWCPSGSICVNRQCKYGVTPSENRGREESRAKECTTELDCDVEENRDHRTDMQCLNGVCMPRGLQRWCTLYKWQWDPCGYGTVCQKDKCVAAVRDLNCGTKYDCYYGMECANWVGKEFWHNNATCVTKGVDRKCQSRSDCPPGMACKNGNCGLGVSGDFCLHHSQCTKGLYCLKRTCTSALDYICGDKCA